MAYLLDEDEDEGQGQQQPQVPSGQSSIVPTEGDISSQSDQGGTMGGANYATLQKYLSANTDKVPALSQNISGKIKGEAQQAKDLVRSTSDQYKSQVSSIKPSFEASQLASESFQPSYSSRGQLYGQLEQQLPQITKTFQEGFVSPGNFEQSLQGAREKQASAENLANLTKDEGGRYKLLKDSFGQQAGGKYSKGQTKLDQALLQLDPGARSEFQTAREAVQGFQPLLDTSRGEISALEGTKRQEFDANKAAIQSNAQKALQNYQAMLQDATSKINSLPLPRNNFSGNAFDYGADSAVGYDPFSAYGSLVNPADFIGNKDRLQWTDIADERARNDLGALAALAGIADPTGGTSFRNPNQINTYLNATEYENAVKKALEDRKLPIEDVITAAGRPTGQGNWGPDTQSWDFSNYDTVFSNLVNPNYQQTGISAYDDRTARAKSIFEADMEARQALGLPVLSNYFNAPGVVYRKPSGSAVNPIYNMMYEFENPQAEEAFRAGQKQYFDLVNRERPDAISNLFAGDTSAIPFAPGVNSYDELLSYYSDVASQTPSGPGVLPRGPLTSLPRGILPPENLEPARQIDPGIGVERTIEEPIALPSAVTSMPRGTIDEEALQALIDEEPLPVVRRGAGGPRLGYARG